MKIILQNRKYIILTIIIINYKYIKLIKYLIFSIHILKLKLNYILKNKIIIF